MCQTLDNLNQLFINNMKNYFKIKEQNIWVVEKAYLFWGEIILFAIFVIIPYISGACVLRFVYLVQSLRKS